MTEPHTITPACWAPQDDSGQVWALHADYSREAVESFLSRPECASYPRLRVVPLYAQPFGFTYHDVVVLRATARWHDRVALAAGNGPTPNSATMMSLAARIESLLPPLDAPPQQP